MPWPLYTDDPQWVPPLLLERKEHLSESHNPYFQHARWQAWTAQRNGEIVGRISAQIDELYQQQHGEPVGYFGMLEAGDNPELFSLLLRTAEDWLRDQGIRTIRGPFNLSINEECGMLVDGFGTPPFIMMGHARPWYGPHVEGAGYHGATDLLAYQINPDFKATRIMTRLLERETKNVEVRCLRRRQLKQELELLRDIFNDAWSENWGFVPFTEAEFNEVGKAMTLLLDHDFVQIAEVDGEAAAMIIALPNVNEAIRDLHGSLLPFGWAKLLWRLKVRYPRSARIPLMGVRKKYQHSRLGPTVAFMIIDALRGPVIRRGIREVEMSWILEDNSGMRNIIESLGGIAYKRYRLYEKHL